MISILKDKYTEFTKPLKLYELVLSKNDKNPLLALRFLTIWALIIHILYRIGIFRMNTYALGIFIFVGSIFVFWIYPGHYRQIYNMDVKDVNSPYYELSKYKCRYLSIIGFYDIIFHYLPLLLLVQPMTNAVWIESFFVLFATLTVYMLTLGFKYVWIVYYYLFDPVRSDYLN